MNCAASMLQTLMPTKMEARFLGRLRTFVGKNELLQTYISDERNIPKRGLVKFDITGFTVSEYIVDASTRAVIAPIKATELAKMNGISDQSLFAYNVRGALGRTQVNKDIVKSLQDKKSHKLFPLFHNGITVIAGELEADKQTLEASDYFVVNGCQSLSSSFSNLSSSRFRFSSSR